MITIKQATESDIPIIEDIMNDVITFLDSIGQPQWVKENVTQQGLAKYFTIDNFYIAYIDKIPMGCLAIVDYDPTFWPDIEKGKSLYIHKLAVKRCGAKKGVSKALIDFVKAMSVELGINQVRLDTHQLRPKVRAVYEKQGFVCVDERCLLGRYYTAFYLWERDLND